ncbi:MAG: cytochrome d ubiquinol oxidase subunit II [Ignavibacteria bacterium RBG_13_36_8]|nr:MAG: cytochrome d ubiquinol oxidase subunit II [Ignavibacteria bacterium RBG_13_36_8]
MDLNIIWFVLIAFLMTGYAILDGFDLGVGVLHLFTKDEKERRINLNAIGPVWDGNEVWLITGGGALFAAFPIVYATVFSGFYLALMLVLAALIFRAVSLEFRGKVDSPKWKRFWDWAFGLGSLLPAILFGVAVGNILRGVPINSGGTFTGNFFTLLNPYAILIGILSLILFTMHGTIYMGMKSHEAQRERMKKLVPKLWMAFVVLYLLTTLYSFFEANYLFANILSNPLFWILFVLLLAGVIYIPIAVNSDKFGRAFFSSSLTIASMMGLVGVGLFPRFVPSSTDLVYSLTIYNASSTPRTLETMLIIALIGMPFVIGYTAFIYKAFKGKVIINEDSY